MRARTQSSRSEGMQWLRCKVQINDVIRDSGEEGVAHTFASAKM